MARRSSGCPEDGPRRCGLSRRVVCLLSASAGCVEMGFPTSGHSARTRLEARRFRVDSIGYSGRRGARGRGSGSAGFGRENTRGVGGGGAAAAEGTRLVGILCGAGVVRASNRLEGAGGVRESIYAREEGIRETVAGGASVGRIEWRSSCTR